MSVKVGLVGCGRISKRHKEAIAAVNGIDITVVCDINTKVGKSAAQELNADYVERISDIKGVDIIAIATPSGHHPLHTIQACDTDAKYIVCEKPISLTVREAIEMYSCAKEHGKVILPVYQNRYNPLVQFSKNLISEDKLGMIYQFVLNVFWNRNDDYYKDSWHGTTRLDGGVLYTQASHYIDLLLFLFGKISTADGMGGRLRNMEIQDTLSAVMKFENGTIGTMNTTASVYRQNYRTELTLIGSKGTVRLSGTNLNTIEFWDVEGMQKPDMDFTVDHIYGKGHDSMYEYIVKEQWDKFPSYKDVISGIELMEKLSF